MWRWRESNPRLESFPKIIYKFSLFPLCRDKGCKRDKIPLSLVSQFQREPPNSSSVYLDKITPDLIYRESIKQMLLSFYA